MKHLKQKYLWQLLLFAVLVLIMASCSSSRNSFTGEISHVSGDTVCLSSQCFKLLPNAPKITVGKVATFTRTKDSTKVNCIKIYSPIK